MCPPRGVARDLRGRTAPTGESRLPTLYQDGSSVWYDTRATVTKLARDRAAQLERDSDKVTAEIKAPGAGGRCETGRFPRRPLFPA